MERAIGRVGADLVEAFEEMAAHLRGEVARAKAMKFLKASSRLRKVATALYATPEAARWPKQAGDY